MKFTIDRFEGEYAVVELSNGQMVNCPKVMIPDGAKEGSIVNISVDETATNDKMKKVTERMNKLFKD